MAVTSGLTSSSGTTSYFREDQAIPRRAEDGPPSSSPPQQPQPASCEKGKGKAKGKPAVCRFFESTNGCKKGDACLYLHDTTYGASMEAISRPDDSVISWLAGQDDLGPAAQRDALAITPGVLLQGPSSTSSSPNTRPLSQSLHASSQPPIQPKPLSANALSNPREFELNQVRRRYKPFNEKTDSQDTLLEFKMVSSDPDFYYHDRSFRGVYIALRVPLGYPAHAKPSLEMTNKDLRNWAHTPFQLRFERIMNKVPRVPLLRALTLLEREMTEIFHPPMVPSVAADYAAVDEKRERDAKERMASEFRSRKAAGLSLSPEEQEEHQRRWFREIHQLQTRFRKDNRFHLPEDLQTFDITFAPANCKALPPSLKSIKKIKLHVPLMYPIEPCTVEVPDVPLDDDAAANVAAAFEEHVKKNRGVSLVSHLNFLEVRMHVLAKKKRAVKKVEKEKEKKKEFEEEERGEEDVSKDMATLSIQDEKQPVPDAKFPSMQPTALSDDKPHVQVIPRPPEWETGGNSLNDDGDDLSDDGESSQYDSDGYELEDNGPTIPTAANTPPTGRHVALSFPDMSIQNIELLYIRSLALVIKCERCKETDEMKSLVIRTNDAQTDAKPPNMSSSCRKCGIVMSVEYRHELMHQGSNRAGYLLMDSCTALDILPSQFIPTCAECSTTSSESYACVRGGNFIAFCKKCHQKMHCRIPDVKFLLISAGTAPAQLKARRHKKEVLGIHAGDELPRRGRCSHYAKSYRWFRFSCCQRVFPCDKCHDAAMGHANEHANRMICGFCSREQNYRPETCGVCHATLTGKVSTGFWEGGKGTRDRVRMSRKDPRKYKRRGAVPPGKK